MTKFTFKRKLPIWKLVLGYLALIVGVWFVFTNLKGFIIIGIGVCTLLVEGSEFDFEKNCYRKIKSIFGIHFGKWQPLPKIDYISVFKTIETTTVRERSAEAHVSHEVIKLNLFYNKNKKIEAYNTYDLEDAFEKAKEIASLLDIKVLDATSKPFKWL